MLLLYLKQFKIAICDDLLLFYRQRKLALFENWLERPRAKVILLKCLNRDHLLSLSLRGGLILGTGRCITLSIAGHLLYILCDDRFIGLVRCYIRAQISDFLAHRFI